MVLGAVLEVAQDGEDAAPRCSLARTTRRALAKCSGLQVETTHAIENLRDLSRGIQPPSLTDKGLGRANVTQFTADCRACF